MTIRYVSSRSTGPDTVLMQFKVVRDQRAVIDGDVGDAQDTGRSPISRWIAWALDYDDFISYPGTTTCIARLQIPRGTIGMKVLTRVETAWTNATIAADIDLGDALQPTGWGDSDDWSTAGVVISDCDAVYNDYENADPAKGATSYQYYVSGDTLDVIWNSVTAPTAGRSIVFLKCISYHEDLNAEW